MKYRELEKLLKANGWYHDHTNGSHYIFKHTSKKGIVVVPNHKGDIPIGTLRSILNQATINYK